MSTRHDDDDHEEEKKGGDANNGHHLLRKNEQEEEEEEPLPYLNEDIVEKIIVKTPAEALFNRLRYVCKPWYNFINNDPRIPLNRLLLLGSKPQQLLIIQTWNRTSSRYINNSDISETEKEEAIQFPTYTTRFIKMGIEEEIGQGEEYDLSPTFTNLFIMACANGLMLAISIAPTRALYVVNPLTNQRLELPLPPKMPSSTFTPHAGFIFLPSIGEYKVVMEPISDPTGQHYIQILTLSGHRFASSNNNNVHDLKWRHVEAPPDAASSIPRLVINEIFYWDDGNVKEDYIVSFDARTEKFYKTPHKFRTQRSRSLRWGGFIDMGGYLCFWHMTRRRSLEYSKFHVWVLMKDSFWTKQYSIDMDPRYGKVALTFGNGEVLILRNHHTNHTVWAYNVKSNQLWYLGNNLKDNDFITFCGFNTNHPQNLKSIFANEVDIPDLTSLFSKE